MPSIAVGCQWKRCNIALQFSTKEQCNSPALILDRETFPWQWKRDKQWLLHIARVRAGPISIFLIVLKNRCAASVGALRVLTRIYLYHTAFQFEAMLKRQAFTRSVTIINAKVALGRYPYVRCAVHTEAQRICDSCLKRPERLIGGRLVKPFSIANTLIATFIVEQEQMPAKALSIP